ncbi:AAA domain-containing protein [Microvirgula sp. AG722]|uniref:AAA domain-containing protein n=1 Tax=Microvirgula sp. AG722 TaxID=2183901 RepID=UPI000DC525CE|nr:AAA domain-containing protein [Microvirgula sp. AG722]RAS17232.1 AAA domain-containing protein [Microvirgula sp. AG722]
MTVQSIAYADYWRTSLADSDLGRGAFRSGETEDQLWLTPDALASGRVGSDIVDACFAGEPEPHPFVSVMIRPQVYMARMSHGKRHAGMPDIVTPVVGVALLARDGRLFPLADTVMPRDILEPLEQGAFSVGTVNDLDDFLSRSPIPGVDSCRDEQMTEDAFGERHQAGWARYLAGCRQLLAQVTGERSALDESFILADHGFLRKKDVITGASKHILGLYDHLRQCTPDAPLFERYSDERLSPPDVCLPPNACFSARLGHASDLYPLADAQRDALSHLLLAEHGEILAVNGPPGTGKTTLLLTVVATQWARAALDGGEPPLILAASTNNQAVTNIIDAFGKDFAHGSGPFAGRWLPDVHSFAAYFPAKGKEAKLAERYQTRRFFESIESEAQVQDAKLAYLAAARQALPGADDSLTVLSATQQLRQAIATEAAKLDDLEQTWQRLAAARDTVRKELGENPDAAMAERRRQGESLDASLLDLCSLLEQWDGYLAKEPLLYAPFSWLAPVARKRMQLARQFLDPIWPSWLETCAWERIEQIGAWLIAVVEHTDQQHDEQHRRIRYGEALIRTEADALAGWRTALIPLGMEDDAGRWSLADCDPIADTRIRFPVFQLTTHYWEGRWLLDMQDLAPDLEAEKRKTGRVAAEKRWRRRMKLTPCVVSTFFMLPSEMKVSRRDGQRFVDDYLYDFADLLIVDEAGQVLPEVAGASFSLAKTALVIGDTAQIEPIWSVPARVDIGNLFSAGILPGRDDDDGYERVSMSGKTAASGSVMRIAQYACRYHYDQDLARGLYLYEHRRCFDEIISYCNTLCYRGKLIARRGLHPRDDLHLPALGYLHVDGLCLRQHGASWENLLEAQTIAAWIAANRAALEQQYDKPLAQIVAVVTPFSGQVSALSAACKEQGISVGASSSDITIGTVHSLQGAERPVVIFSPVYSKHADGSFIDRRPSMLNVAVSRAKDSFLVFGDMDTFAQKSGTTPRGLLGQFLFREIDNALSFDYQPRPDLISPQIHLRPLRDAQEHDAFLLDTLASAQREVHVVSPWIKLERIEQTGALAAMNDAVSRGVQVHVYTDLKCNVDKGNPQWNKHQALRTVVSALSGKGISMHIVHKVHSKIVIGDDSLYCVGSFNWFSASRDEKYARHETSLAYCGADLCHEITVMKESLQRRTLVYQFDEEVCEVG